MKPMIDRIVTWIKANKLATFLIVVVLLLLGRNSSVPMFSSQLMTKSSDMSNYGVTLPSAGGGEGYMYENTVQSDARMIAPPIPGGGYTPTASKNRLVIRDTSLSLVVKNVSDTVSEMIADVQSLGGFLVSSNISTPVEGGSGNLSVRVPVDKLDQVLERFRSKSVRVVDENVSGTDVTDQYEDLDERLRILKQTKSKFEELYNKATEISDLLNLQNQILSVQSQIDSVIGQQKYLTETAKYAHVMVYLSTDELSLPFAPNEPWRPAVVFKYAYRSLLVNLQKVGSAVIWIVVYSIVWIPVLLIILFLKKRKKNIPLSH